YSVACLLTFFISSRRRHTRSSRDWSSDVCSSDLGRRRRNRLSGSPCCLKLSAWLRDTRAYGRRSFTGFCIYTITRSSLSSPPLRSEERRVGKEGSDGDAR